MNESIIEATLQLPEKLLFLMTEKSRYKVAYGGRGSAKSWSFAGALIFKALEKPLRILCTREYQNSIKDSVHSLLKDTIYRFGLQAYFHITEQSIRSWNGSEFIFKGLAKNIKEIKSMEGIDICWVEEATKVSKKSWEDLIPTIRKESSEIWVSFNPDEESDETYQMFVINKTPDSIVVPINFYDNPWFPLVLKKEMEYCKEKNYEKYEHIWEGKTRVRNDAQIFKGKWKIQDFELPVNKETGSYEIFNERLFFGADWGFANDPTVLIRDWIKDRILYIEYEAFGHGVELDEIPQLFDSIPESRKWNIKADNSRPETISHVRSKGFDIEGAEKWPGSVEDGIEYLRSFENIIIHPRCKRTIDEFKFYCYKTDKNTNEILPIIIDKHNHGIDSIRYSLESYIKKDLEDWEKLYNITRGTSDENTRV